MDILDPIGLPAGFMKRIAVAIVFINICHINSTHTIRGSWDEERLKVYRAMYNLTQEELAKKLDVTRQTIIAIERGK